MQLDRGHGFRLAAAGLAGFLVVAWAGKTVATGAGDAPQLDPGTPVITAVVELFTSQGCSSCPPADALLRTYAERSDIVALSLPVDYWDYLGWKDTFASPKNSDRQRAYAKTRGDGAVYTPQVVVNGVAHVNGASARELDQTIKAQVESFSRSRVPVRFWRNSTLLVIDIGMPPGDGAEIKDATIWLAVVQRSGTVEIRRGENDGRTVTYSNIVRELAPIGMWSGKPMTLRIAQRAIMQPGTETCAVLLQQGTSGPIIGAAWLGY